MIRRKSLLAIAGLLLSLCFFCSCGKDKVTDAFLIGTWSYEKEFDGEEGAGWKKGDLYKGTLEFYEGGTGRFKSTNLVSNEGTDLPTTWAINDKGIINITYSVMGNDTTLGVKADLDKNTLTRVNDTSIVYEKEGLDSDNESSEDSIDE